MSRPVTEEPQTFGEKRPRTVAMLKSTAKTVGDWLVKAGIIASILTAMDRYGVRPVLSGSQDKVDDAQEERITRLETAMISLSEEVKVFVTTHAAQQRDEPRKRGKR